MWTDERILHFIELYRKKEVLWNTKHPRHFNKMVKNDGWEEIAAELETTGKECRKKMTVLLSAMRREKAKIKKSLQTAKTDEEVYQSQWFAFNSLKFLWNKDKSGEILKTVPVEEELVTDTDSLVEDLPDPTPAIDKKRKRQTNEAQLEAAFNILTSVANREERNENRLFADFIAKKMEKYSEKTASSVQNAIMNVLYQADQGFYEQSRSTCAMFPIDPPHTSTVESSQIKNKYY